jgi:glycine/D-amino acid oxidase-like deaminating enzyme
LLASFLSPADLSKLYQDAARAGWRMMHVVICGGGVIGAATAYFLSVRGVKATVIERTGLGCAASGKAGGFLALDWCDGTRLQSLARRSFALHAELAQRTPGDWGYRRLATYGGIAGLGNRVHRRGAGHEFDWLSAEVGINQTLGTPETTAQVHPARFTAALMRAAQALGAELRVGRVTGLLTNAGRVAGVAADGKPIAGDAVVIAMGPWSILAAAWLPLPAVFGLKGHSLVFETGDSMPEAAAFLEYRESSGSIAAPELFPRPDGTTYVCAISSEAPLPVDPADVAPDEGAIERLETMCRDISPVLGRATILARQACYRPVTSDGLPLIGRVPGIAGAYIATGHSVWGILNAPATGEAIAELITDGAARTVDLAPFDPARAASARPGPTAPARQRLGAPLNTAAESPTAAGADRARAGHRAPDIPRARGSPAAGIPGHNPAPHNPAPHNLARSAQPVHRPVSARARARLGSAGPRPCRSARGCPAKAHNRPGSRGASPGVSGALPASRPRKAAQRSARQAAPRSPGRTEVVTPLAEPRLA